MSPSFVDPRGWPAPSPSLRMAPIPHQLGHASFVWVAELVHRPEACPAPPSGVPDSYPLVSAFAAEAPAGAALQLRFGAGASAPARTMLVGRARSEDDAAALATLVELTLPPGIAACPLAPQRVPAALVPFELDGADHTRLAELRRVTEEIDRGTEVIIGWGDTATTESLETIVGRVAGEVLCCVHLERSMIAEENLEHVAAIVGELRDDVASDPDPALLATLGAQRALQRELSRTALSVRVVLAAPAALPPGLAALVGVGVAGIAGDGKAAPFALARPLGRHEFDVALQPIDAIRTGGWGIPGGDRLGEVRFAFGVSHAAQVFRLPVGNRPVGDPRPSRTGGGW